MPEMVLSSSFLLHYIRQFGYALPYGFKPKYLVLWYLVLKFFTLRSLPLKNCLNLQEISGGIFPPKLSVVIKVRYLSVTGFLKRLITLSSVLIVTHLMCF